MIQLSYCTFGLTNLAFSAAIDAVDKAGYPGVELSFHRDQFNPFEQKDGDLSTLKRQFARTRVQPACIATASYFFTPSRPHEPSMMCIDLAGHFHAAPFGQVADQSSVGDVGVHLMRRSSL